MPWHGVSKLKEIWKVKIERDLGGSRLAWTGIRRGSMSRRSLTQDVRAQLGEFTCRRLVSEVCQHSQWSCPWADMAVEPKLSVQGRKRGPSDRKGCREDNKKWVPLSRCYGMNWVPPSSYVKIVNSQYLRMQW